MSRTISFRLEDDEAQVLEQEADLANIPLSAHIAALVRYARQSRLDSLNLDKAITALDKLSAAINKVSALPQPAQEEQLLANLELLEHMRLVTAGGAPDKVAGIQQAAREKTSRLILDTSVSVARQAKDIAQDLAAELRSIEQEPPAIHIRGTPPPKKPKPPTGFVPDGTI